jgi:acyl-CoA hydrolase
VQFETSFVGPGMRRSERLTYIPCRLSTVPVLFRTTCRPDVVVVQTSSPRRDTVSLGTEVNVLPAAIEAARTNGGIVIAQANPHMPYTYGDAQLYETEIDFLVEVDEPLPTHPPGQASDVENEIADFIASRVADHSTLQLGIGSVPDSVLASLQRRRGLRIWSEMFSDGVMQLDQAGALDDEVPLTASFLIGSADLYSWAHRNKRIRLLRTERTNDPGIIARQRRMTSINSALQVDLFDQVNASRVDGQIYSGFGGSTDFIVGATHSLGGQSFIALPSWHAKTNSSTIVPLLNQPVTSFQHTAVVTEHGIAEVFGRGQSEQAEALIDQAAHPEVREELREAGRQLGLHV